MSILIPSGLLRVRWYISGIRDLRERWYESTFGVGRKHHYCWKFPVSNLEIWHWLMGEGIVKLREACPRASFWDHNQLCISYTKEQRRWVSIQSSACFSESARLRCAKYDRRAESESPTLTQPNLVVGLHVMEDTWRWWMWLTSTMHVAFTAILLCMVCNTIKSDNARKSSHEPCFRRKQPRLDMTHRSTLLIPSTTSHRRRVYAGWRSPIQVQLRRELDPHLCPGRKLMYQVGYHTECLLPEGRDL